MSGLLTAVVAPLMWIWLGGTLVLAHYIRLGSRGTSVPFSWGDLITCTTWPISMVIDMLDILREPRP